MIEFEVVPLSEVYDEIRDDVLAHYEEACFYPELEVNPSLDVYQQLQDNGYHFFMVARDTESDKVVGYISFVIAPLIQFEGNLMADMELIYVLPEYRREGLADRMLKEAERILVSERDVSIMSVKFKINNLIEEFAINAGYEPMEIMYTKKVGGDLWETQ